MATYCAAVLTPTSLLGLTRAPSQKRRYHAAWTTMRGPRAVVGSAAATTAMIAIAVAVVAVVPPAILGVAPLGVVPAAVLHGAPAYLGRAAALVVVGAVRLSWH